MCEVLDIASSSYYKWLNSSDNQNDIDNKHLINLILHYHVKYEGILGYRRMTDWLNDKEGFKYNYKRVRRLMRYLGIRSTIRAKRKAYAYSTKESVANNILNRDFNAKKPNEKWLTDVTEFKITGSSKKLYLSAVLDLYDLSIIAYQMSSRNDNDLVFKTFDKAFKLNPSSINLIHSDQGYQYTSLAFKKTLKDKNITQSMSRAGCCIDNGPIENFWGQLKVEKYYLNTYRTEETLGKAIDEYIDFYNNERLQKRFDNKTPRQVRLEGLIREIPKFYPIPANNRIKGYWEDIEIKNLNKFNYLTEIQAILN